MDWTGTISTIWPKCNLHDFQSIAYFQINHVLTNRVRTILYNKITANSGGGNSMKPKAPVNKDDNGSHAANVTMISELRINGRLFCSD
jgi:hypothetical protein